MPPSATAKPSLPCAFASLASLEVADLRFETQDLSPAEIGALADRVEQAIGTLTPPIGIENVLIGLEKLADRFALELPDAELLEADVRAMADWPADRWMAAFDAVWANFRSGWSRFPTLGDFRDALASLPAMAESRAAEDLRRLASRLRQEQGLRARTEEQRRRVRAREAALAERQRELARCRLADGTATGKGPDPAAGDDGRRPQQPLQQLPQEPVSAGGEPVRLQPLLPGEADQMVVHHRPDAGQRLGVGPLATQGQDAVRRRHRAASPGELGLAGGGVVAHRDLVGEMLAELLQVPAGKGRRNNGRFGQQECAPYGGPPSVRSLAMASGGTGRLFAVGSPLRS
ncbi:hypothetical protein [Azospirillum ramasamyi]|uniref:hypothetical protein n=1 Tax=Azospirillum ramasamyi TaxID=682998 RepID=UPI003CCC4FC9